jgi:hypothetical protein
MNIANIKWHHRIAHFPEIQFDDYVSKRTDFCSYWRLFVIKLFLVIPTMVLLVGGFLGWYLSSVAVLLTPGLRIMSAFSGFMWVAVHCSILLMIMCTMGDYYWKEWRSSKRRAQIDLELAEGYVPPKDSIFVTKYKSFKGKYCPKMEY